MCVLSQILICYKEKIFRPFLYPCTTTTTHHQLVPHVTVPYGEVSTATAQKHVLQTSVLGTNTTGISIHIPIQQHVLTERLVQLCVSKLY